MKKKSLLQEWSSYKNNPIYAPVMKHRYFLDQQNLKSEILSALIFWQFVRREVGVTSRKEFCKHFLQDSNELISLVAHIELLPDKVWRKILWVENIDFVDYEATLRRITKDQEYAIIEAVAALGLPEPFIPKVFLKNFWDILKVFLGFITAKKLLAGPYGEPERYFSKGAWAFNLLSIDFGFSLYPNGVNDDTKITNKKFSRFLSIKEHINDFIVNKEDGIYWLLYRSARSNFVWFPKKEVELSDHVCPGFWKTLLIHLLFWVVSPICFTAVMIIWMEAGSFPFELHSSLGLFFTVMKSISVITTSLILSLTPIWLLLAFLKIIGSLLVDLVVFIAPSIVKFLVKAREVAVKVVDFFDEILNTKTAKMIGKIIWKLVIIVSVLAVFTGVAYLGMVIWPYLVQFYNFLTIVIKNLLLTVSNHPYSTVWSILALVVIIFSSSIMFSTKFEDREYAKYDKVIRLSVLLWIIISIVMGYLTFSKENIFDFGSNFSLMTVYVLNFFALGLVSVLGMTTMEINMDTVEERVNSKEKAVHIPLDLYKGEYDRGQSYLSKFKNLLLKNKWILSLKIDEYEQVLKKLNYTIDNNYGLWGKEKDRFLFIVLPVLDPDLLRKLSRRPPKDFVFNVDKFSFLYCLCSGMSYKESFYKTKKIMNINVKKSERKSKWQKKIGHLFEVIAVWNENYVYTSILWLLKIIFWPFVKLYYGIAHVVSWIKRFSLTLKDIWSLFNERCPYISKSEFLE